MFLIALAAFVVTSSLTGAAPNSELLIAARLLQASPEACSFLRTQA